MPRKDPRLDTPAKTVNEAIQDATIRHMLYMEGLKTQVANEILKFLDSEIIPDLKTQLAIRLDKHLAGKQTTARLEAMIAQFEKIVKDFQDINIKVQGELFDIALYEADFQMNMLKQETPVNLNYTLAAPEVIRKAITDKPFDGRLLNQWFESIGQATQNRLASEIRRGVTEGQTTQQIVKRISDSGILETTRAQTNAVVRTAIQHTVSVTRDELFQANADLIKGLKYVATLDSRTSDLCKSRDGKVYDLDKAPPLPAHINCLTGDTRITSSCFISKIYKRAFKGEVFTIVSGSGHSVTVTPNHPILTNRGWIAAQFVNVSDKCFISSDIKGHSFVDDNNDAIYPTIEQIFESFRCRDGVITSEVPISSPDFHGDTIDNEVTSVLSKLDLGFVFYSPNFKHSGQSGFVLGDANISTLYSGSNTFSLFNIGDFSTFGGNISFANQLLSLGGGSPIHPSLLLRTSSTDCDSLFPENPLDWARTNTATVSNPSNADSVGIEFDDIISVERRDFSGHVYNVETGTGFVNCNNIITHNCRSAYTPVLKSFRELGIDIDEAPSGTRASMNGQVPSDTTYGQWLKGQPVSVQNDALGVTKATLFRKGDLPLDRFINRNGHELTLAELKVKESKAFERAKL